METITLNTGIKIPVVGSGTNTFGKVDHAYQGEINDDTTEILMAIDAGYRHFDTAISYRNESVVGKALGESKKARSEFFITSKIPGKQEYYADKEAVKKGVKQSLQALNTAYIDLYLIHHPWDNLVQMLSMWQVLEDYVDQGKLKAIGVSNFNEKELGYLIENGRIKPAVNQVESHPRNWNDVIINYSLAQEVVPEAWGPLTRVSDQAKEKLSEIGAKYNKTWAQVILRYQIERGVVVIPKSHNQKRQEQNLEIFDFKLSDEDKQFISAQ
ncbi:aldo/keto reductase [Tetragenococcus halophilus]|uniref:aldo/keto reductase family protein n=1 Tax=Tetragenococcus halophilus TaxID=51669 RepID=UPI00083D8928|nr:aldo/keto reductase [Tetragenococcus halophilus]AOF49644.1 aldo/keto reductase [Tetragenococcus halophilus]